MGGYTVTDSRIWNGRQAAGVGGLRVHVVRGARVGIVGPMDGPVNGTCVPYLG
jgi:hypothetical protein